MGRLLVLAVGLALAARIDAACSCDESDAGFPSSIVPGPRWVED